MCPLTRKRIVKPARGVNCTHLECFDLATYVEMGFKSFKWSCPVCQKYAPSIELKLDIYLMNVFKECGESTNTIEILKDFTWRDVNANKIERKNEVEINLYDLTEEVNETIVLDDDDESEKDIENSDSDMDILMTQISEDMKSFSVRNKENEESEESDESVENEENEETDEPNESVSSEDEPVMPEKEPSPVKAIIAEANKVVDAKDTECPACKRKFKGVRGLNCHLRSKTTTCKI